MVDSCSILKSIRIWYFLNSIPLIYGGRTVVKQSMDVCVLWNVCDCTKTGAAEPLRPVFKGEKNIIHLKMEKDEW